MLTVKNFLNLAPFNEMKVISGQGGLDNIISSVNIMDNPDALDWFSVGELLLTSGYFFKESLQLQNHVMKQLKTLNCPALCVKPHRYLGTIPQNMIDLSNELDLPIIELPYGLSFSKIMSRVMEELSGKYDLLNQQSLDIHSQFFNISLHGGGLQQISVTLAKLCESSVLLLDRNWSLLYWTDLPNQPYPLDETITPVRNEVPFPERFIQSFPPDFKTLQKPIVRLLKTEQGERDIHCTVLPVFFQSKHYGFIVLWEPLGKLDEHTYVALENGAMAFSLERIHSDELERARNRIRRDFLDELLMGKITSKETLSNLADLHGVNLSLLYTAIVFPVSMNNIDKDLDFVRQNEKENFQMKQVLNLFDQIAEETKESEIIFSRKRQIIVLLGCRVQNGSQQQTYLKEYAELLVSKVEETFPQLSLKAAIGRTVPHINEIHESFHQAQETLRLMDSSLSTNENKVFHFEEFIVQHFLMNNIERSEMQLYFHQTLGELHRYDQENKSDLLVTLESLVANRFNVAETSRALFIHRNTLLYRMEKIEFILQMDFKDAEELLKIQLSLKIYRLLDLEHSPVTFLF